MNLKALSIPIALLLMGAGATVAAQATSGGGGSDDPPAALVAPTVLDDWCDLMAFGFGPGTGAPSVTSAFDAALTSGTANPEVAYVALLEGVPIEVELSYGVLRTAGIHLVDGTGVTNAAAVRGAAAGVDAFIDDSCDAAG